MQLQQRINAFVSLGRFLGQFASEKPSQNDQITTNALFFDELMQQLDLARVHNSWFTSENLRFTCFSWSEALSEKSITDWLSNYTFHERSPKTVAIIMAGNIPLVGFHDFLAVLMSGNKVLVKLSSNDKQLLPFIAKYLIFIEPEFEKYIEISENKLENFDAVIATGSNNTARYFDYYFGKYPHIIRKNRNSVAILKGAENNDQLVGLADDIFRYFGLGCRNVSKLYVPFGYNFDAFFNGMYSWKQMINNNKYINNYDYNKAVYLMSGIKLLDNEFLLLKEDVGFSSPIAVVFYEYYSDLDELRLQLAEENDNIQCIVSEEDINFGQSQLPKLKDYADGVDSLSFLLKLT